MHHHRSVRHGPYGPGFHGRGPYCGIPPRARLQRRLFLWFGATILFTGLVVGPIVGVFGRGGAHSPLGLLFALVTAAVALWTAFRSGFGHAARSLSLRSVAVEPRV